MTALRLFALLTPLLGGLAPPSLPTAHAAAQKPAAVVARAASAAPTVAAAAPGTSTSQPAAPVAAAPVAAAPVAAAANAGAAASDTAPRREAAAPQTVPVAERPDWLTQSEAPAPAKEPLQHWPVVVAMLLLALAGAAFLALRLRQGQILWPGATQGLNIEILATKALGPKHRLVVVEALGERLLLAASEREVRLLSHIASADTLASPPVDFGYVQALQGTMQADASPAPHAMAGPPKDYVAAPQAAPMATAPSAGPVAPEAVPQQAPLTAVPHAADGSAAPGRLEAPESLSAAALYEGAARSLDLDAAADEADDTPLLAPEGDAGHLASDVAGLARWRQAAAQGADAWGKHI